MKQKVETLQADLSRRQESYIRRERAFNMRIEELEEEVGSMKVRIHIAGASRLHVYSKRLPWRLPKRCAYSLRSIQDRMFNVVSMLQYIP